MFGYQTELNRSIVDGRREQLRKSAVSRKAPKKLRKKKKRKGTLKYKEVI